MDRVIGFPFVAHVEQTARPTIDNPIVFLRERYNNRFNFGIQVLLSNGIYKVGGYVYDFRPYLKRFVYKQYGSWTEAYAPNKTSLRKIIYGKIDEIVEVK